MSSRRARSGRFGSPQRVSGLTGNALSLGVPLGQEVVDRGIAAGEQRPRPGLKLHHGIAAGSNPDLALFDPNDKRLLAATTAVGPEQPPENSRWFR